jgi:hypothetical protein
VVRKSKPLQLVARDHQIIVEAPIDTRATVNDVLDLPIPFAFCNEDLVRGIQDRVIDILCVTRQAIGTIDDLDSYLPEEAQRLYDETLIFISNSKPIKQ